MLAELEEHRRGKWDVLMLSQELKRKYSSEVESRMPLETARTGSERGVWATQEWATGPYSTKLAWNRNTRAIPAESSWKRRDHGDPQLS